MNLLIAAGLLGPLAVVTSLHGRDEGILGAETSVGPPLALKWRLRSEDQRTKQGGC